MEVVRNKEKIKANEKGRVAKTRYRISSPVVSEILKLALLLIQLKQRS